MLRPDKLQRTVSTAVLKGVIGSILTLCPDHSQPGSSHPPMAASVGGSSPRPLFQSFKQLQEQSWTSSTGKDDQKGSSFLVQSLPGLNWPQSGSGLLNRCAYQDGSHQESPEPLLMGRLNPTSTDISIDTDYNNIKRNSTRITFETVVGVSRD